MSELTLRQKFGYFKKSFEGTSHIIDLKNRQLGLCYLCKKPLHSSYDIDHKIPLTLLDRNNQHLATDSKNLYLSCPSCNRSKKNKLEAYLSLKFKGELLSNYTNVYSDDVYKFYKSTIKSLIKGVCEDDLLQERWCLSEGFALSNSVKETNKLVNYYVNNRYPLDFYIENIQEILS